MNKIVISILLTLLLGPGAGHLYLRKYRRGFAFIGAALLFAIHLAWQMAKTLSNHLTAAGQLDQDPTLLLQTFSTAYPKAMLYYDILLAALWAYAIYDVYYQARALLPPPPANEENPDQLS